MNLLRDGVIENSDPSHVNGASVDVTLGRELMIEQNFTGISVSLRDRHPLPAFKYTMDDETGYRLMPGEFVLAHTQQAFNLPLSLTAQFHLKSSAGRVGLQHALSGWCDPGWNKSVLTLELTNSTRYTPIIIRPGDRIGQMTFIRIPAIPAENGYGRRGRYNGDSSVSGCKP
jgi:dCTP deaminase